MKIDKPRSKIVINNRLTHDGLISDVVKELIRLDKRDRNHRLVQKTALRLRKPTKMETVKSVFDYVVRKVPYKADPSDREHITAPIHLIAGNVVGEDCESMVLLLSTLLNVLGIETKYTVLAWRKKEFTHVILKAKTEKGWIELDPTQGMQGFGKSIPKHIVKRSKDYGVPKMKMKVETLEDRLDSRYISTLSDCGCEGLSDCNGGCKCGGKCGKKGKHNSSPQNQNIINIPIGNALEQIFKGGNANGKHTERIIEIDKPYPVVKTKEKKVPYMVPDALTHDKVRKIGASSDVPVRVLQTQNTDYIYREWY